MVHEVWNYFEETSNKLKNFDIRSTEIEMSECIYENDSGESVQMREIVFNAAGESDEAVERMTVYEVEDYHRGHNSCLNTGRALRQNTLDQQPGEKIAYTHILCIMSSP